MQPYTTANQGLAQPWAIWLASRLWQHTAGPTGVHTATLNCCVAPCRGAGSSLLQKPRAIENIVRGMHSVLTCPVTIKVRKGFQDNQDVAHTFLPQVSSWGASAVTLHGRSRQQRYRLYLSRDHVNLCCFGTVLSNVHSQLCYGDLIRAVLVTSR